MKQAENQLLHEVRNAAAVIRGAAVQLHDGYDDLPPATRRRLAEMVARRSDLLVRLLEDLTTISQLGRGELQVSLERVDLAEGVRAALAARVLPPETRLTLDLAPAAVLADADRLQQVLDNLITNALRYGGSHLTLTTGSEDQHGWLRLTDDGPGVPEEFREQIFEPYTRGPGSGRVTGNGLGLAIVRELCVLQHGAITYEPGSGATFLVRLPAVPQLVDLPGPDVADQGHTVAFWEHPEELTRSMTAFAAHGLVAGEAVVLACTAEHHAWVRASLESLGLDYEDAVRRGQLVPVDAALMHRELERDRRVDPQRYDDLIGATMRGVAARWKGYRAFGEIVDLYWRTGDGRLALELEACWDDLRSRLPFPLLCAYELGEHESARLICDSHDAVVAA